MIETYKIITGIYDTIYDREASPVLKLVITLIHKNTSKSI